MKEQQYPLDKIIVMTLERSIDRQWAWIGASSVMQVDLDIVYFVNGKDNKDFGDDMKVIADAADKDGFPFVADYAIGTIERHVQQTAATACQCWNYARILRYLIETKQTALIIFDDKMITSDFDTFLTMVHEVQSVEDEEFYALQMLLRGSPQEIKLPDITEEQRVQISTQVYSGMFGANPNIQYRDNFLQQGIYGYDESIVWSPKGAEWMLKCLDLAPNRYRYLDHFICQDLPDFAQQAIKMKKAGIYCPSEIGYKFVDVYLEFKTTTDWATPANPFYKQSINNPTRKFLSLTDETPTQTPPETKLQMQLQDVLEKG